MNVTLGVGMLGYAFMDKANPRAFHDVLLLSPPLVPQLVSISGRNSERVEEAREAKDAVRAYDLVYQALGGE
jgi:hypothetical protein